MRRKGEGVADAAARQTYVARRREARTGYSS